MARARELISSLINVASSWDLLFHQLKELQCLHHGATFVLLWSPILSSQPRNGFRHIMASVLNIKITEALFIYYALLNMLWNEFDIAEIKVLWLSHIELWTRASRAYSIINPWGVWQLFFLVQWYVQNNQLKLLCFQKVNKQEAKFVILQSIRII